MEPAERYQAGPYRPVGPARLRSGDSYKAGPVKTIDVKGLAFYKPNCAYRASLQEPVTLIWPAYLSPLVFLGWPAGIHYYGLYHLMGRPVKCLLHGDYSFTL